MKIKKEQIRKILIIQLRAIGDVVQTTAALPVLYKNFPQAKIHFLTTPGIDEILRGLPELEKVLVYPYSPNNILGIFRFFPQICRQKYDLVIDYQGTPGTAYLTKLSGAKYRLGWKLKRRQWAYNYHSSANRNLEYVAIQKCRALQEIGIHEINRQTKITISESDIRFVKEYYKELKIDSNRLLVNITPKGKRQARQWFPEKIAKLADLLIEKHQAIIFYNWASGEKEYADTTAKLSRNPVTVLPGWSLPQFAAFLSRVDLHFSYDNGPKHLAIAAATPTLSLFATDPPALWNPLNDANHPYLLAQVPCKFCGLRECDSMICMKQIEPEDVLKAIEKIPAIQAKLKLKYNY